jgi:Coenzyme PQQ synthesis protein D (PqqD)
MHILSNSDLESLKTATVVVSPDQVSSDLGGESVILNVKSGTYFGLNEVGSRVWQLLQSQRYFCDISATLCHEYVVDAEVCDRDLLTLLKELYTAGLILVNHGESA